MGDACKDDSDNDKILNKDDSCPENKDYFNVNLEAFQTVALDPKGESQVDPIWVVKDKVWDFLKPHGLVQLCF